MTLRFNIFGFEVAKIDLTFDQGDAPILGQEKPARKALGKAIGRISTAWVATGMRA